MSFEISLRFVGDTFPHASASRVSWDAVSREAKIEETIALKYVRPAMLQRTVMLASPFSTFRFLLSHFLRHQLELVSTRIKRDQTITSRATVRVVDGGSGCSLTSRYTSLQGIFVKNISLTQSVRYSC